MALRLLEDLPPDAIAGYQPAWVLRAHCEQDLGSPNAAATAATAATAVRLTGSPQVADYLHRTLTSGRPRDRDTAARLGP
ncbi:MAG: hypothetical protein LH477_09865 [Nocardioides sp.]|nr:hypothetical protein [Nocardioides sp.]